MSNNTCWYLSCCRFLARSRKQGNIRDCKHSKRSKASILLNAIKFAGWDITENDVFRFAYFGAAVTFAALFLIVILSCVEILPHSTLLFSLPALPLVPVVVLIYLTNYPKYYSERLKIKTIGKMPEAINYLGIAMTVTPCLDKAIEFAADNIDEPMATEMKKLIWNVRIRKYPSTETALVDFANDYSTWNEDFKQALYTLRTACLEATRQGVERCIDKATDIIITGTKTKIDKFAQSLAAPTMILFSIGVLLPMILSAMLPMLSITALGIEPLQLILIIVIVFPLVTFLCAHKILGKRPGTISSPNISSGMKKQVKIAVAGTMLALAACTSAFVFFVPRFFVSSQIQFSLFTILGIGLALGGYFKITTKQQKNERDRIRKVDYELPDSLFILGSRIAENESLETAIQKTSAVLKNSAISNILTKTVQALKLKHLVIDKLWFGKSGILESYPSRNVKAAFRAVSKASEKDNISVGKTIIKIAGYLRDLTKLELDINSRLSSVTNMMQATAAYFAPLILGITVALYTSLSAVMADIAVEAMPALFGFSGCSAATVSPAVFSFALGLYLILLVLIILYFCSGIAYGEDDKTELRYQIGRTMPVAVVIFVLAAFLGQMMIKL